MKGENIMILVAIIAMLFAVCVPKMMETNYNKVCTNYCNTERVIAISENIDGALCGCTAADGSVSFKLLTDNEVDKYEDMDSKKTKKPEPKPMKIVKDDETEWE